jgi:hypothetical protein
MYYTIVATLKYLRAWHLAENTALQLIRLVRCERMCDDDNKKLEECEQESRRLKRKLKDIERVIHPGREDTSNVSKARFFPASPSSIYLISRADFIFWLDQLLHSVEDVVTLKSESFTLPINRV